MAEVVLLLAREKLERLVVEKGGAEELVRWLISDLRWMVLDLHQGEAWRITHYTMSLADIAHDADAAVDTFSSNTHELESSITSPRLDKFMEEIQCICSRRKEVDSDITKYYQSAEAEELLTKVMRLRFPEYSGRPQIQEEDVVGLQGDVKLLLKEAIFQKNEELSILWIVGMGGIGKSTVASLLYDHAAKGAPAQFEICVWLHMSNELPGKVVLIHLIGELGMEGDFGDLLLLSATDLQGRVFRHLQGKTYFIVLDNLWSWDQLEFIDAFPQDSRSRLVITSRSKYNGTEASEYIHEMKTLDPNKSWELFLNTVFSNDRQCPENLKRIGRQIVRNCNDLPLAIQEAGRMLKEVTESESAWEEFLESMDLSETAASLHLSFDKLSPRLKSCFVRLGFFKEGATIRAEKLVQVWVAGGILPPENHNANQTDEEIGRGDLDELIREYLVQVKDRSMDSRVKNCEINYNLHRIAMAKAREEILFEVITEEGSNFQSSCKPRHRAVFCSRKKFNCSTDQDKHLLSLFFHGGGDLDASPSYWKSFELLKILDLEGFGLKSVPGTLGELVTVKYLGLRNNYIQELPRSFGQLGKLEVLDIAQNFMVQVPNIIWKMRSLRHLYMSDIICEEPLKIDKLCSLQTLTYISVDNWKYEVSGLEMMTSLRKLGIEGVDGNSDVSKLFTSLAELMNLECLILRGYRFRSIPELEELHILYGLRQLKLDGLLTRLPSAKNFPPKMEYLCLSNSCLDEDPMPILEKLPELLYLKLRNAYTGKEMVISGHGFSQLQVLCIEELWHLTSVEAGEGAMPGLTQWEIKKCPYLQTLPGSWIDE